MITNIIQFLMTPNVLLSNIFLGFFAFVEFSLYIKFITAILHIEVTTKQKGLYIIVSSLLTILSNCVFHNPYTYLINLITLFFLISFVFKQKLKNVFIVVPIIYVSIFVSFYLVEIIFRTFLNISVQEIANIPIYYFITCSITYVVFYIISILIKQRSKLLKFLKLSLRSTIIINLIFGIISIFIQSYIFSIYKDNFPSELILITITCLIMYFSISMYSLIRTNKLEKTTQDLETEKLYNKTLSHLHDNIRCFKHDFNNIVQSIGGYIALNDMNGLREYYNNLLEDCKQTNNLNILNPETINNPSIYSLLTNKYYLASEKGIKMTFNIFVDLSAINCNIYEFTRILGILLDNAIEAAEETEEKIVNIEFKTNSKKQIFIIENSCKDNNISITKIFEKGYSTKKRNSGIGLWKVHTILSKNTNMDLFTTVTNNTFKQQLDVFYN